MIRVEIYDNAILADPIYQVEQTRISALCGVARTWETYFALMNGGEGHRALELGAWPLYFSRALKERYEHVIATDSFEWETERMSLMPTNPTAAEWQHQMGYGIETQQADARRLPWPDKYFDAVYSVSVIEHIPEDEDALREMLRVGRRVIMTTDIAPERVGYFNYGRVYSPETLRTLLKKVARQSVAVGEFPPKSSWMYGDFTCCGCVIET